MGIPLRIQARSRRLRTIDGCEENPAGDRNDVALESLVEIQCSNCGRALRGFLAGELPQQAKWRCRVCGHVTHNIKTRDEVMDTIEGHIEEGTHDEAMKRRRSINLNTAIERCGVMGVKLGGKVTRAAVLDVEPPKRRVTLT